MKHLIGVVFLFYFTGLSCDLSQGTNAIKPIKILYDFGNESVCNSSIEEQCFSSPEEFGIYLAAQGEQKVLRTINIDLQMEKEIGEEFHRSSNFKFVDDHRTEKLREILNKMKQHVSRKEINYQVFLIKEDNVNAWTVPGGRIYFTTGMYEFAQSDHELANILGHEIGHNECKHTHKQLQRMAIAELPLQMFGFNVDAAFFVSLYNAAFVAFGQHQEMEADRNGFQLAAKVGYDPKIGLEFWKRLSQNENPNALDNLFRSHPYSTSRYQCGIDYIGKYKVK